MEGPGTIALWPPEFRVFSVAAYRVASNIPQTAAYPMIAIQAIADPRACLIVKAFEAIA
jgi:hypothetical protein